MMDMAFGVKISSEKGFYVGDICYVLSRDVYHGFWGDQKGFKDGAFEVPDTGFSFAVAGTAYGDGTYQDQYGNKYPVDAGVIGLVPLELVDEDRDGTNLGYVCETPGTCYFMADDGKFEVQLPDGKSINIDTEYHEEYEDEEEWWNDEYSEDNDKEEWD